MWSIRKESSWPADLYATIGGYALIVCKYKRFPRFPRTLDCYEELKRLIAIRTLNKFHKRVLRGGRANLNNTTYKDLMIILIKSKDELILLGDEPPCLGYVEKNSKEYRFMLHKDYTGC